MGARSGLRTELLLRWMCSRGSLLLFLRSSWTAAAGDRALRRQRVVTAGGPQPGPGVGAERRSRRGGGPVYGARGAVVRRYTREELLALSGAQPEELARLEAQQLLVPCRRWRLFGRGSVYFTEGQLDVLRGFVKAQRAIEISQRPRLQSTDTVRANARRSGDPGPRIVAASHVVGRWAGAERKEGEDARTAATSAHHTRRAAGVDG